MSRLSPRVRLKAIEIANAVLARDMDEGKAIRIGIAQARKWALRRRRQDAQDFFWRDLRL